ILGMFCLLAACAKPLPDNVTELVYATPYSPSHPFSRADQIWMAHVEQASGGTLRIRPNWSGGVLSSEMSMTELRHGLAAIGLTTPLYVKGGTHTIRVQAGFYSGVTEIERQIELYRCMEARHESFRTATAGLKILA